MLWLELMARRRDVDFNVDECEERASDDPFDLRLQG